MRKPVDGTALAEEVPSTGEPSVLEVEPVLRGTDTVLEVKPVLRGTDTVLGDAVPVLRGGKLVMTLMV